MRIVRGHLAWGLAVVVAVGCTGVDLVGPALDFGRRYLLEKVGDGYSGQYAGILEKLIDRLSNPDPEVLKAHATGVAMPGGGSASDAGATSAGGGTAEEPLQLEVALMREVVLSGRSTPVPILDGDVLRDGVDRAEEGDGLRIRFRPGTRCFVHVIALDGTGWAQAVFPGPFSAAGNPVPAGQWIDVPDGDRWYELDEHRGVETLYFAVSRVPRPDLDEVLAELASLRREDHASSPQPLEQHAEVTRGLGGVRPSRVSGVVASDGSVHSVASSVFLTSLGSADLVVTRWFRHE